MNVQNLLQRKSILWFINQEHMTNVTFLARCVRKTSLGKTSTETTWESTTRRRKLPKNPHMFILPLRNTIQTYVHLALTKHHANGTSTNYKLQTRTNDKQQTMKNEKQRQKTNNYKWQTMTNDKQQMLTNKTILWMHITKADHLFFLKTQCSE